MRSAERLVISRMPLAEGVVFAGYTVIRLLGSGGMGEVYLAQHPRLPRRDALKILPRAMTADREFRDRFHREADLALIMLRGSKNPVPTGRYGRDGDAVW